MDHRKLFNRRMKMKRVYSVKGIFTSEEIAVIRVPANKLQIGDMIYIAGDYKSEKSPHYPQGMYGAHKVVKGLYGFWLENSRGQNFREVSKFVYKAKTSL